MEKRKMYNAYADLEGYNCFGCSPTNPYGLKCKFVDEGEYVTCHWMPSENYQGFFHVLHGGIQATLIDEIASWAIFSHEKNELAAEADVVYMIYPEELARKKLDWPGVEAFYKPVEEKE